MHLAESLFLSLRFVFPYSVIDCVTDNLDLLVSKSNCIQCVVVFLLSHTAFILITWENILETGILAFKYLLVISLASHFPPNESISYKFILFTIISMLSLW